MIHYGRKNHRWQDSERLKKEALDAHSAFINAI